MFLICISCRLWGMDSEAAWEFVAIKAIVAVSLTTEATRQASALGRWQRDLGLVGLPCHGQMVSCWLEFSGVSPLHGVSLRAR